MLLNPSNPIAKRSLRIVPEYHNPRLHILGQEIAEPECLRFGVRPGRELVAV
jgi:hypothetical protein